MEMNVNKWRRLDGRRIEKELHMAVEEAIIREKRLKKWNRQWKLRLIEEMNPDWNDLWASINA